MTFFRIGLSGKEAMPMSKLFKNRPVNQPDKIEPYHKINMKQPHDLADPSKDKQRYTGIASQTYKEVKAASNDNQIVLANEIMSSPVEVLSPSASIAEALAIFHNKGFRHLPIVSPEQGLIGILSDRDVLRYMSGVTSTYNKTVTHDTTGKVTELMVSNVLSASSDTDVRYIARLFVENRIGAIPVVLENGDLAGIITRSNILDAVMRHFNMALWA